MSMNRSTRPGEMLLRMTAALLILPVAAAPAVAAPRSSARPGLFTSYSEAGSVGPRWTGSLQATGVAAPFHPSRRSSTSGNAEFPERDPIAQNLGGTAGGGIN
ncbi:hypothetical protein MOX02_14500 [Methylobacterium oxalidis]|uniref:Uncharacterized protein n=1 Tax=Methylobacterium oxalidis TaxID=944322 RepID=A0A512J0E3_9HYPH|nr:hypothetical protein MOX02_14500 [Methylobacterium oxalidis]GLS63383.1 hypothetical protein GCM10007888_17640 [Methylobacterium oxalidis]